MMKSQAVLIQILVQSRHSYIFTFWQETTQTHFKDRTIGIIEAVYDLLGYHKHQAAVKSCG
jgi:hypothetical protein